MSTDPSTAMAPSVSDVPAMLPESVSAQVTAAGLSTRERSMLEFERQWWKFAGSKEEAIRQQFDMSGTRYFQILNDLIDRPEALAADPLLVKRLRRMRSSRQKARAARNLGMRLD